MPRTKRVIEPRPPIQNKSGHYTQDAAESAFMKDVERKANMVKIRIANGTQTFPVERNPLLAEKTPRHPVFGNWDYTPLSSRPGFENPNYSMPKWNHPNIDYGLLSKLNSQAPVYAKEKKWADDMYRKVEEHKKTMAIQKAEDERKKAEEKVETGRITNRDSDGYTIPTVRSASTINDHEELHGPDPEVASTLTSSRSVQSERLPTTRSQMSTDRRFYTQPVSTFKSLIVKHPEILEQWRANRAAEYVTTLKDPLDAPSTTRIALKNNPHRGFKPASTTDLHKTMPTMSMKPKRKSSKSKVDRTLIQTISPQQEKKDTARMREELKSLQKALADTNEEIDRQQLKINLNTRTKNYERLPNRLQHSARSTAR